MFQLSGDTGIKAKCQFSYTKHYFHEKWAAATSQCKAKGHQRCAAAREAARRRRGGAGCSRRRSRARGRSESSAEEHSPAESFGPQTKGPVPTGGAIGAGEALGRTEEAAAEPSAPGQYGGRDTKSRSLNCCSHRAEEQGARLSQPRCLHGTLPATEGGETPTTPGLRGAQPALGWMATVDLNTVNVNNNHHFRDRCLKIQDFSNSGITEWLATL